MLTVNGIHDVWCLVLLQRRCNTDEQSGAMRGSLLLLAVGSALSVCTSALYEDQAGGVDWHQQHVGPISSAALHKLKPRLFVATTRGVVASLNLRDGSIAWRKLLDDGADSTLLLEHAPLLLSASASSCKLRAWDQIEGGLQWESALSGQQQQQRRPSLTLLQDRTVAVLCGGALSVGDQAIGKIEQCPSQCLSNHLLH